MRRTQMTLSLPEVLRASVACATDHTPCLRTFQAERRLPVIALPYSKCSSICGRDCEIPHVASLLCRATVIRIVDNSGRRDDPEGLLSLVYGQYGDSYDGGMLSTILWITSRIMWKSGSISSHNHNNHENGGSGRSSGGRSARLLRPN
jgi:hypothetical protein